MAVYGVDDDVIAAGKIVSDALDPRRIGLPYYPLEPRGQFVKPAPGVLSLNIDALDPSESKPAQPGMRDCPYRRSPDWVGTHRYLDTE